MATRTKSSKRAAKKRAAKQAPTPVERRGTVDTATNDKGKFVEPVHVDSTTARSDEDARIGNFAKVVSGKHQGRYGVFDTVADWDKKDGYPTTVVLVTRDENAERLVVDYKDLRPADAGFRGRF